MKWRNSKFKLILVCLLTVSLVSGLYGFVQASPTDPALDDREFTLASTASREASINASAIIGDAGKLSVGAPYYGAIKGQVRECGELPANPIGNALVVAWRMGQAERSLTESGPVDNSRLEAGKVLSQPLRPHFVRWTVTDKSGFYTLADLPPGIYRLGCFADWYKPAYARVEVKAGEVTEQNFALVGPFGALGGRVTQYGCNNPVPGATILAFSQDKLDEVKHIIPVKKGTIVEDLDLDKLAITPQQKEDLKKAAIYETRTDRNGYYFIPFVKLGEYWVIAIKDNMYAYQETKIVPREVNIVNLCLRLPISPDKKVQLQGGAGLKGEVQVNASESGTEGDAGTEISAGAEMSGNAGISNDHTRDHTSTRGQVNASINAHGKKVEVCMITGVDAY